MNALSRYPAYFMLMIFQLSASAQSQTLADSLITVYSNTSNDDPKSLRLLTQIVNNQTDPQLKLRYVDTLLSAAMKEKSLRYLHHAYLNEGQAYRIMGDFDIAIYSLFKALDYAERDKYQRGIAAANTALADVYSILGDHENSVMYYNKALSQISTGDSLLLATILLNLGDEYYMSANYDSALACFDQSREIYERIGSDRSGLAYNLGNIGLVKAEQGNLTDAEDYVRRAIAELARLEDHYGIAIFLSYMAEIYQKQGLLNEARSLADSSMSISQRYQLKAEVRDNSQRLADIYAMNADYETAYKYHQQYVALKDSISNDQIYNRIDNLENAFELAKKQSELNLLRIQQRNQRFIIVAAILVAVIISILALIIFRYYRAKSKINQILEDQKRSLESLNETKDKFFSIISHDLRGPISSFHGVSSMIKYFVDKGQTKSLLAMADDIDESVDRLSGLLDNLLSWAMQQQGHLPNVPEKHDLKALISETVETFRNMSQGKGITLSTEVEDGVALWTDKNATMTILRNLINNALKFTPPGGQVSISGHEEKGQVSIRITDTGVGIAEKKLKKIFRLEDKKSTYGTAGEKGLGLGLQLVYEFVEMVGGQISATSREHEGTTFEVKLPIFEHSRVGIS